MILWVYSQIYGKKLYILEMNYHAPCNQLMLMYRKIRFIFVDFDKIQTQSQKL